MGGGGLPITDFSNSQNTSHREACRSNLPQSNITQNLSDFSKQKVLHKIGIAQKGYFTIARGVLASSNCSAITGTLVDYCGALLGNLEQMPELIFKSCSCKFNWTSARDGWNALTAWEDCKKFQVGRESIFGQYMWLHAHAWIFVSKCGHVGQCGQVWKCSVV